MKSPTGGREQLLAMLSDSLNGGFRRLCETVRQHVAAILDPRLSDPPPAAVDSTATTRGPFVKLAPTVRKHAAGILTYLDTKDDERAPNNSLRVIARRASGFHFSTAALISMLSLCCGGIALAPPVPTAI